MSVRRNGFTRGQHRPVLHTNLRGSSPSSSASSTSLNCPACFRLPLLLAFLAAASALIKRPVGGPGPWSLLSSSIYTSSSSTSSSLSSSPSRQLTMDRRVWRFLDPPARTLLARQTVGKGDIPRGSWEDTWLASNWELQDKLSSQWGRANLGRGLGGVTPNMSQRWHTESHAVMDLKEAADLWRRKVGCEAFRRQHMGAEASTQASSEGAGRTSAVEPSDENPSLQGLQSTACSTLGKNHITVFVAAPAWLHPSILGGYHSCPRCSLTCQISWSDVVEGTADAHVYVGQPASASLPRARAPGEPLRVVLDLEAMSRWPCGTPDVKEAQEEDDKGMSLLLAKNQGSGGESEEVDGGHVSGVSQELLSSNGGTQSLSSEERRGLGSRRRRNEGTTGDMSDLKAILAEAAAMSALPSKAEQPPDLPTPHVLGIVKRKRHRAGSSNAATRRLLESDDTGEEEQPNSTEQPPGSSSGASGTAKPWWCSNADIFVGYTKDSDVQLTYADVRHAFVAGQHLAASTRYKRQDIPLYRATSNCEVDKREDLAKRILSAVPHHSFGACQNSVGGLTRELMYYPDCDHPYVSKQKQELAVCVQSHYKFVLAMENTQEPSYVTEKFYSALTAGAVPIYYGAADIASFAPPGSYIDVTEYRRNLSGLIQAVWRAHTDPVEYMNYRAWEVCGILGNYSRAIALGFSSLPCRLCEKISERLSSRS